MSATTTNTPVGEIATRLDRFAAQLAEQTPAVASVLRAELAAAGTSRLPRLFQTLTAGRRSTLLGGDLPEEWAAAIVSALAANRLAAAVTKLDLWKIVSESAPLFADLIELNYRNNTERTSPLTRSLAPIKKLLDNADPLALANDAAQRHAGGSAVVHFFEHYLKAYNRQSRTRQGVYYTPHVVVRSLVAAVDDSLTQDFQLPEGLATDSPDVSILDPAMGSAAFLVEVIRVTRERLTADWRQAGASPAEMLARWNAYVPHGLLPRLSGMEISLAAWSVAQISVAAALAETGYQFASQAWPPLLLTDALDPTDAGPLASFGDDPVVNAHSDLAYQRKLLAPATVIVGNPPFSGLSDNRGAWIDDLLRGRQTTGASGGSYYEVDGEPLGERKLWLQDDYVKFLRLAHWQVASAGAGVIGMVTGHGWLDNSTFRGMRQQLLKTFPLATVIDLHGNQKKRELTAGREDRNIFAISQGIALSVLAAPPRKVERRVRRGDLWGLREEKLSALRRQSLRELATVPLQPASPAYRLAERDQTHEAEYARGFSLTDAMPTNTTAPVTARDGFVVAHSREELLGRFANFRDLSIGDEEIRARYFQNSRSRKYPPGDTRGWKLSEARRNLAADNDWQACLADCQYRPLDVRPIYWSPAMIDWPRAEVSADLLAGGNLALIARRQMPPSEECNYFWITDRLALDGVIRSDNRGSESLFPLYITRDPTKPPQPNLAPWLVDEIVSRYAVRWQTTGAGDLQSIVTPHDLLHLFYATFFSPTYRARYATQLRDEFPRLFLPRERTLFANLVEHGRKLASLHCKPTSVPSPRQTLIRSDNAAVWTVASGCPSYDDGQVKVNPDCYWQGVPEEVWNFRVGGHQVCRKWLRDRRGRELTEDDLRHYERIVHSLVATLDTMQQIDAAIALHGGWPAAFASVTSHQV